MRWIKGLQDIINKHKAEYKDEHLLLKEEAERHRDIEETHVHMPKEGTEGRGWRGQK